MPSFLTMGVFRVLAVISILATCCVAQQASAAATQKHIAWKHHLNNLTSILQHRSHLGRVSLVDFNLAWARMLENYIYAMQHHAKVHNFFAVATTPEAATFCQQHNIPCFNATTMLQATLSKIAEREHLFMQGDYNHITWAKVIMAREVLHRGYHVHYGDVDTVYYREMWPNFVHFAKRMNADAVAMSEFAAFNAGNYFFFSNSRTKAFFDAWIQGAKHVKSGWNDQNYLPQIAHTFKTCCTYNDCKQLAMKAEHANKVRIAMHTAQGDGDWGATSGCVSQARCPPAKKDNICDFNALYMHAICKMGFAQKRDTLRNLGLWFLDKGQNPGQKLQKLPCTQQTVWEGVFAGVDKKDFTHRRKDMIR